MHYDEVISKFLEKDKKILYVGNCTTDIIDKELTPSELHTLNEDSFPLDDTTIPTKLDYIIFTDTLELVDNPKEIISQLKWNSEQVIVYEFKHREEVEEINPNWKKPWLSVGLENFLTWEFDYVRSVYLGYATVYFCASPNDIKPEELNKE